jgi:hypothetical protein
VEIVSLILTLYGGMLQRSVTMETESVEMDAELIVDLLKKAMNVRLQVLLAIKFVVMAN